MTFGDDDYLEDQTRESLRICHGHCRTLAIERHVHGMGNKLGTFIKWKYRQITSDFQYHTIIFVVIR